MQVNSITGLKEAIHPRFKVPLVYQRGIGLLRLNGQMTAVHTAPLGNGLTLDWYARLPKSDELLVTLQGANRRNKNIYPMFARVESMKDKGSAHIAVADPTLLVDESRQLLLSWYLGGPGWDPLDAILRVIRRAMGKIGAKHVAFIGGSGGGFAALRASAKVPGSLAFVQEAQTDLRNYSPGPVDRYFRAAWPGWDRDRLLDGFPERFDMVRHYRSVRPKNYVYYVQSEDDASHVSGHFRPFAEAHGIGPGGGDNVAGDRRLMLYKGEVIGHGQITPGEYDAYFFEAMKYWRLQRAS